MSSNTPSTSPSDPAPQAPKVRLYTTSACAYCVAAKRLLGKLGLPFDEVDLTWDHPLRERLSRENDGYSTVPMIFVEGRFIGGYRELSALEREGGLAHLRA